jgi:hypothetical protein
MSLRKIIEGSLVGLALAGGMNSGFASEKGRFPPALEQMSPFKNQEPSFIRFEQPPTLKDFKGHLKGNEKEYDCEKLKGYWDALTPEKKGYHVFSYSASDSDFKELPEKLREDFELYHSPSLDKISEEEIEFMNEGLKRSYPWNIDFGKLDLNDKLFLYFQSTRYSDFKEDM